MASTAKLMLKLNWSAAATLIQYLRAMPPDKQTWKPLDVGRSALDQVQECIGINGLTARALRDGTLQPIGSDWMVALRAIYDTPEKAAQGLAEQSGALVAAIRQLPKDRHRETVESPWNDGRWTMVELMEFSYWKMVYHIGQISYIQTLYGDNDHH